MTMAGRKVLHQTPTGTAPDGGWPVVLFFHGWYLTPESTFTASSSDSYGLFNKAKTASTLLSQGYAIIAAQASQSNADAWYTNVSPWALDPPSAYNSSGDGVLLEQIVEGFGNGAFGVGCCTLNDVHAVGFSSGAYMTSRMAFLYPGLFRSLSIQSGSYYYCGGSNCPTPASDDDPYLKLHPPTLFLHGADDQIVPPDTSLAYYQNLLNNWNRVTSRYTEAGKGHQWIDSAPTHIPNWIQAHSPTSNPYEGPYVHNHSLAVDKPKPKPKPKHGEAFQIEQNGKCLQPTGVVAFGVLRMGACDESSQWVRWESGAISHKNNTGLCIRLNTHEQNPKDVCWRGNTLWLESCFEDDMSNYFNHDMTSVGSLLSGLCPGKCLAYDEQDDVTLLGNCTEKSALGWALIDFKTD